MLSDGFNGLRMVRSYQVPPKVHQKVALPAQVIALFLHSSTRTSMVVKKKIKKCWISGCSMLGFSLDCGTCAC